MISVSDIQQGDPAAFDQVYYEYHERFYFYVLKQTSSADLAEEVVQASFIKLWVRRRELSSDYPIAVQLARIVRTTLIDMLRKKAADKKLAIYLQQSTPAVTDDEPLLEKELKGRIDRVLGKLPPVCRQVYKMSREEELSHKEIARLLSISPRSVENHIARALRIMKRYLTCLFFF